MEKVINVFVATICLVLGMPLLANESAGHPLYEDDVDEVQEPSRENGQIDRGTHLLKIRNVGQTNGNGRRKFTTIPFIRNHVGGASAGRQLEIIGDFIDVNGDGLLDYVVAYSESLPISSKTPDGAIRGGNYFYRATFLNSGDGGWEMCNCEWNMKDILVNLVHYSQEQFDTYNFVFLFVPCDD